jgi:hypothetical protein
MGHLPFPATRVRSREHTWYRLISGAEGAQAKMMARATKK